MTKVLFTHSYFYKLDPKQWKFKQPYPPLGTIIAAAVIREQNFKISFFDTNLKDSPTEIIPILEATKPKYLIIYDDGFNYLTKMCLTVMRDAALLMIEEGKKRNCTVIVSSSDAADHYDKYILHGADYIVRGEGEETLKELLNALEVNGNLSIIQGLAYKKEEKIVLTVPRQLVRDLDSLPLPAWNLIDIDSYKRIWLKHHGYFSLNLATTRGCPYKCNWCAKPIYGNRYNSRSPEHVVREIELLLEVYQPNHFWMCDDIFGLKPGWIQSFRDEIKRKNLSFRYKIQSRVDLLLEEDNIETLAQSGAETIWVGAESGSQKILDAMDKGTTVDQIATATTLLKKKGIKVGFFLQLGYLEETQEDINATLNMVLDLMPDEIGISVSYPLPGTKFYEKVKGMLSDKQNWSDSDDLSAIYKSTFTSAYYKKLHRYIHNRYRIQRGINQLEIIFNQRSTPTFSSLRKILSMLFNFPLSLIHGLQLKKLSRPQVLIEKI